MRNLFKYIGYTLTALFGIAGLLWIFLFTHMTLTRDYTKSFNYIEVDIGPHEFREFVSFMNEYSDKHDLWLKNDSEEFSRFDHEVFMTGRSYPKDENLTAINMGLFKLWRLNAIATARNNPGWDKEVAIVIYKPHGWNILMPSLQLALEERWPNKISLVTKDN